MAKTTTLPGLEPAIIPAITEAAEQYAEKRDARMALLKEEVELKNSLITLMHANKLESYRDTDRDPPISVELKTTDKVKVKVGDQQSEEEE
jgi:hypothetical protein